MASLDTRHMKTSYHKKMMQIEEIMGPVTYRLKLPQEWKIHDVFHAMLLKLYTERETYRENYTRPPPKLLEEQEVYEVETIVKHRRRGKGYQYFMERISDRRSNVGTRSKHLQRWGHAGTIQTSTPTLKTR